MSAPTIPLLVGESEFCVVAIDHVVHPSVESLFQSALVEGAQCGFALRAAAIVEVAEERLGSSLHGAIPNLTRNQVAHQDEVAFSLASKGGEVSCGVNLGGVVEIEIVVSRLQSEDTVGEAGYFSDTLLRQW